MNFPAQIRSNTRKTVAALAIGLLSATALTLAVAPASQAAAISSSTWSVSNNQAGAATSTYTYDFKTATAGVIKTVTFTVSGAGLAGSPTIGKVYGLGAGTVSIAGQTITYTVTNPASVAAFTPLYIEVAGLTNPAAGSYTTSITTNTAAPAVIDGPTNTPAVTMGGTNTALTATVAKSFSFAADTSAFQLGLDPSLPALADQTQPVVLSIKTNANSGYTVGVSDSATGLQSSAAGNPVLAKASTGKATSVIWPGADKFGYSVTGTGATVDPAFTGSKFAGYTSAGETIATRTGPTGATADAITINNRVAVDYAAPAGDYTDTITYTAAANYS